MAHKTENQPFLPFLTPFLHNFSHNPRTNILYQRLWYLIQIPYLSKYERLVRATYSVLLTRKFVDAIELSVDQTAAFNFYIIWYCDETAITLIAFLKVGQVSQVSASTECKARPRRTG